MLGFLRKVASMFERADLPELPPPEFRDLPPGPGYRIVYYDSLDELDREGRRRKIAANDAFNPHKFLGWVDPHEKVVGLPRPGLLRDPTRDNRLYSHEVGGHSNELEHAAGGHEWGLYGPDRAFYPVKTRAELNALKARLYPPTPPAPYDWSKAFAPGAPNALRGSGS